MDHGQPDVLVMEHEAPIHMGMDYPPPPKIKTHFEITRGRSPAAIRIKGGYTTAL